MARRYSILLSEEQLAILSEAADMYSRVYMGQLDVAAPYDATYQGKRHELVDELCKLGEIISGTPHGSYGIRSPEVPEHAKMAYDMHRTFRHRLAWDRNPEGGIQVWYDPPGSFKASKHALPYVDGADYECLDCKVDTSEINEYYMVKGTLWLEAMRTRGDKKRMLCLGCLEERIGRTLTSHDFLDVPVNVRQDVSDRFKDRRGRVYCLNNPNKGVRNLWQDKVDDDIFLTTIYRAWMEDPDVLDVTNQGLRMHDGSYLPVREEEEEEDNVE